MEEQEAIARLKQGDISGLETLVRMYQVQAVRAAFLVTHDRALAEDVVQAAFVRAFERIDGFDTRRAFGPWFLRSVVNDAVKAVARLQRRVSLERATAPDARPGRSVAYLVDPGPGPDDLLELVQTREAVWAALSELPPEQRAAIVLRYYLGLSEAEMAGRMGCPPGTIKWRLHAARERLRTLLRPLLSPWASDKACPVQDGRGSSGTEGLDVPGRPQADEIVQEARHE